jgi:GntR family transcriptional regulator
MDAVEPSKTHRLYLLLKERIVNGHLAPGHRLPSESDLATTHKLSRVTVRRALDGLAHDGLIQRRPGAGTFIAEAESTKAVVGDLANTLAHLLAMGRSTRVKLLSFGYEEPPQAIREALRIEDGERAQRSVRVRFLDDAPFSYLVTHVPERIGATYSERELSSTPLLKLLERSGVAAARARQKITATLAGPDVAPELQIEIGSPLISLTRTVYGADGRGVEHLAALYRPDLYTFEMELTRTGSLKDRRWHPVAIPTPVHKRRKSLAHHRRIL